MYQPWRLHIVKCTVQILGKSIKNWAGNCSSKIRSQNSAKCGAAKSRAKENNYIPNHYLWFYDIINWCTTIIYFIENSYNVRVWKTLSFWVFFFLMDREYSWSWLTRHRFTANPIDGYTNVSGYLKSTATSQWKWVRGISWCSATELKCLMAPILNIGLEGRSQWDTGDRDEKDQAIMRCCFHGVTHSRW